MASLFDTIRRLGAVVHGRKKKVAAHRRELLARRLQQPEALEQRALLSLGAPYAPPIVLGMPTGAKPPTEEQLAWERENMIVTQQVRLNELGIQRINAQRSSEGLTPLDVEPAPLGQESVGMTQGQMDEAAVLGAFSSESVFALPAAVDNSTLKYFPPIRSQGGLGSCVAFSETYYTATYMTALARNWDVTDNADNTNKFSPKWTYNTINWGNDGGAYLTDAYAVMLKNGAATWADFPYVGSRADPKNYREWVYNQPDVWEDAVGYRMSQSGRVTNVDTDAGLTNLKTLLANGYILNYGTQIAEWQFTRVGNDPSTPDDDAYVGKDIAYWLQSGTPSGHSMTVVGYNDNIWVDINGNSTVDAGEKGAVRIANSWGRGWSDGGFTWLAYDALKPVSAVSGGPSTNRAAAWWGNQATWITARASYAPAALAEFTVNHAQRNQIEMSLGVAAGGTTPSGTWNTSALNNRGGALGFDGSDYSADPSSAPDGTFVLDFSDLNSNLDAVVTYFVGLNDTTDPTLKGTLKSFKLLDGSGTLLAASPNGSAAGSVPVSDADGASSVAYAFLTYSNNHAPVLSTAPGARLNPVDEDATEDDGTSIVELIDSIPDMITDVDLEAEQGIAVTAARANLGTWEFSTDAGETWAPLGKVSDSAAMLLAADGDTRLRFVPWKNYSGTIEQAIALRAWDRTSGTNGTVADTWDNGGFSAFSTSTRSASITVSAVNDPPILDTTVCPSLPAIDEDPVSNPGVLVSALLAAGGVDRFGDVDGDALEGIAVTAANNANGDWEFSLDGGDTFFPFGEPTAISARLLASDENTRVRFAPGPDFIGTVKPGLSFRAWDQSIGANGDEADTTDPDSATAFSGASVAASIVVNPVNDAPVLDALAGLSLDSIFENAGSGAVAGTSVAAILASAGGTAVTDPDHGAAKGVAVIGVDRSSGAWEYSLNGGVAWSAMGAVSESLARLLAANAQTKIRFLPSAGFVGQAGITLRAWDQTTGANGALTDPGDGGGTSAFSADAATAWAAVNPVNHAPWFALARVDVPVFEDAPAHYFAGQAFNIAAGPDYESGQSVYFEVTNDHQTLFAVQPRIAPDGALTFTPAPDVFGFATVTVRLIDDGGTENGGQDTSPPQTFTITVLPVNHAPSFAPGPDFRVSENSGPKTVAGWATELSAGPASEADQTWTFTVQCDNPGLFAALPEIAPDGTLTFTPAQDASGETTLAVTMTDSGGIDNDGHDTSDEQWFKIKVAPVNARPVAFSQRLGADANTSVWTTLSGDDRDPGVEQALRFAIVSGPSHGKIAAFDAWTGELTYTPDANFFGQDSFTFQVNDDSQAGSPAPLTSEPAAVAIQVFPVVRAPATGAGDNNLVLRRTGNNLQLLNRQTNQALLDAPLAGVSRLTVIGAATRGDRLTVDFTGGAFQLPDGLVFDAGTGSRADTIALRGSSGADVFSVAAGRLFADGIAVEIRSVEQVNLEGGAGDDRYFIATMVTAVGIADSGGTDEINFSQAAAGVRLDMNLSRGQAQAVIQGQAILSLAGTIENAVGSPHDDRIRGNSAANRIHGGAGNDTIYGGAGNDLLYGDDGDDWLYGERGNKVLVGGDGNDHLVGGSLRNVLIGGRGADEITGAKGEDILIGGQTSYDASDAALTAILAEWTNTRKSYSARVDSLTNGISGGTIFLKLNATVLDDFAADRLNGGGKTDWFLDFAGDVRNASPTIRKSRSA